MTPMVWSFHAKNRNYKYKSSNQMATDGKRPRKRPRKRWIDGIKTDLEALEVTNWENRIQDRNDLITVMVAAEYLTEL